VRRLVGGIAERFILCLCFLFGRRVALAELPWLDGPIGPRRIGADFHRSLAESAGLELRAGDDLGLLASCTVLDGPDFDSSRLHPAVRDFYEHTSRYHLEVWSQWSPLFWLFGWALINFVSRRMEQLNFPMYPLETARGMTSDVEQLVDRDGRVAYTSWLRRNLGTGMVIYSGFYSSASPPGCAPCVKVVFPLNGGNATVLLRPVVEADGSLKLISAGKRFGDPGFYRVSGRHERARVWHVTPLVETFHVYPDADRSVRTDHHLSWWGLSVLHLHYHITPASPSAPAALAEAVASTR
jgi:hypothetical protein